MERVERVVPDVDAIIAQMHDRDLEMPDKQFRAVITLGAIVDEHNEQRIVDAFIVALNADHQALTRAHAAQELGKLKNSRAFAPILKVLKDEYQLVRAYAAQALEKFDNPESIPDLLQVLLTDDFYGAKAEAAKTLGVLCKHYPEDTKAKQARQVLEQYLENERKKDEEKSKRVLREVFVALDKDAREVVDAALALQIKVDELQNTMNHFNDEVTKLNQLTQDLQFANDMDAGKLERWKRVANDKQKDVERLQKDLGETQKEVDELQKQLALKTRQMAQRTKTSF